MDNEFLSLCEDSGLWLVPFIAFHVRGWVQRCGLLHACGRGQREPGVFSDGPVTLLSEDALPSSGRSCLKVLSLPVARWPPPVAPTPP